MQKRWIIALYALALSGCSILLDPEVCDSDSDCNGGVCKDGICIGGSDEPQKQDASKQDGGSHDASWLSDAEPQPEDALLPEPDAGVALACALVGDPLVSTETVTVTGSVALAPEEDEEDAGDGEMGQLTALLNNDAVALVDNQASGEIALEEGVNWVSWSVDSDLGGHCASRLRVEADWTGPELSLDEMPSVVSTSAYVLSGHCTDAHAVDRLEINDASADVTWFANGDFETTLALVEGNNDFKVQAFDEVGNASESKTVRLVLDSVAPDVALTSPVNGAEIETASVAIRGTVTSGGVPEARMSVDLTAIAGGTTFSQTRVRSDGSGVFEGELALQVGVNDLKACATDEAGHQDCAQIQVTRLDQRACVQDLAVAGSLQLNGQWMTALADSVLSGQLCSSVTAVTVAVTSPAGDTQSFNATLDGHAFSLPFTMEDAGVYALDVTAVGPEDQATAQFEIALEKTAPLISISQPNEQLCVSSERVQVCGQAHDPESGIVSATLNGEAVQLDGTGAFCVNKAIEEGANVPLTFTATNALGLESVLTRTISVDRTPPEITLDACNLPDCLMSVLSGGSETQRRYRAACDADNSACGIAINGSVESGSCGLQRLTVNGEIVGSANATGRFEVTRNLPEGNGEIRVVAIDLAGNQAVLVESITVDGTAPQVKLEKTSFDVPMFVNEIQVSFKIGDAELGQLANYSVDSGETTCGDEYWSASDQMYWRDCTSTVDAEHLLGPSIEEQLNFEAHTFVHASDLVGNQTAVPITLKRVAATESF